MRKNTTIRVRYVRLDQKSTITNSRDSWIVEIQRPDGQWQGWSQNLYRDNAIAIAARLLDENVIRGDEDASSTAS